jgi:hypothetical protein
MGSGYGVIQHDDETQLRVRRLVPDQLDRDLPRSAAGLWQMLSAAHCLASATMYLVVHMTYTRRVNLDGEPLEARVQGNARWPHPRLLEHGAGLRRLLARQRVDGTDSVLG